MDFKKNLNMNEFYFVNYYNLKIGDRVVREKGIVSKHHGIYAGIDNGRAWVAENQRGNGVQYITLSEFLLGNENTLTRIERFKQSEYERQNVISRINALLGKPYDLVNFNCEHFAELIQTGNIQSRQVRNAVGVTVFALFLGLLFSSDN